MKSPILSVVMSVYNGAPYLKEAMDSILAQTFKDFEFIIVDDGSSDTTPVILESYKDPRIHILRQDNMGLVASLNRGVQESRGTYIARQDADDISLPDRFEKEYGLLSSNPGLVIVGSSMSTVNMSGQILNSHYVLLQDPELKQELLVRSPFAHGSVIFRKEAFEKAGGYLQNEWPAEDYGLWLRMATYGGFANMNELLYRYRENTEGISRQNDATQLQMRENIRDSAWKMRKRLIPAQLDVATYNDLEMGNYRAERVAANLLYCLYKALPRLEVVSTVRLIKLLSSSQVLRRKCARLILVKLRIKHA